MLQAASILESEIRQQPDVIGRLIQSPIFAEVAAAIRKADPQYVLIAARGTSDNAARYAQYLFGVHFGLPVALAAPSITTLYGKTSRYRNTLVIGISQSGTGPDVTQVVGDAAAQGALTIAITNNPESPLAKTATHCLALDAGLERSVAATKTYTAELTALAALTAHWAESNTLRTELDRLPQQVEAVLATVEPLTARAERFRFMSRCVTLARGYNYATAFEIALKLTELTYVVAEPYSSADFRHGPKALIEADFPAIAIAPSGAVYADMLSLMHEVKTRGADLTIISDQQEALDLAALPIPLPADLPEWLSPIVAVVPGQWLAMAVASAKGVTLDAPRAITKVTNTR
ncbi:MAG: SIS domain-containing protein [Aggregatilineales bacterium]